MNIRQKVFFLFILSAIFIALTGFFVVATAQHNPRGDIESSLLQGVVMSAGPENPSDGLIIAEAKNVPMLQISINAENESSVSIKSLTLEPQGTGDDENGISNVAIYRDNGDEDGQLDENDLFIDASLYPGNNIPLTFIFEPPILLENNPEKWLVLYDFTDSIATGQAFTVNLISATAENDMGALDVTGFPILGAVKTVPSTFLPLILRNSGFIRLINGDFETGNFEPWQQNGQIARNVVMQLDIDGLNGSETAEAIQPVYSAELGNPQYSQTTVPEGFSEIRQGFFIPANETELSFVYRVLTHDIVFNEYDDNYYDSFEVFFNSVNYAGRKEAFCRTNAVWQPGNGNGLVLCDGNKTQNPTLNDPPYDSNNQIISFDLSEYAGQYITVIFRVYNHNDNMFNTWAYIDDIKFSPTNR